MIYVKKILKKKKKESGTSRMQVNVHCVCFLLQNMSDIKS